MKIRRISFLLSAIIAATLSSLAAGWPSNYGGVMLQCFYWDSYNDSKWTVLESQADELANYFDIIWVPNSGQSSGSPTMGYLPIYWFTNHNSSFGTQAQLTSMIQKFRSKNVNVIMDLVINHRMGVSNWADFPSETWNGNTYQMDNSCVCRTDEWGRNGGNPTGANDEGDDFDGGRDLDHTNAKVQRHCKAYCDFLLNELGYAGFRLDMVKGYAGYYTKMYNEYAKPRFSVGEYWDGYDNIVGWIESTGKESAAFDFPAKYAMNEAFSSGDMNKLCWLADGWDAQPAGLIHFDYKRYAVTFIDNHDTYRNDWNKFNGNVLAAHAFMLCSPGTPCVFLKHWLNSSYKPSIKKMIAIRKAVGVTNTSKVVVLQHTGDCYMAEVTGNNGKLVVKVGSSMTSPSDYSNSDIKASGTDWCIWTKVDVPDAPGPVDKGEFKVYWDNSSAKWSAPKVHYFGGVSQSTWPGVAMTKVSGTQNVYEITVPSGTTGLVFNSGSSQTDDLNAIPDHLYTLTGDGGAYGAGDTGGGGNGGQEGDNGNPTGDTMTIYFDNNTSNWSTVKMYTYPEIQAWSGKTMEKYCDKVYRLEIPSSTSMIIFNNGDNQQTVDISVSSANDKFAYVSADNWTDGKMNPTNDGTILPSKIYVIGQLWGESGKDWKPNSGVELTKSGNVYRGMINLVSTGSTAGFSFVQALSSLSTNWSTCNGKHRYGGRTNNAAVAANTPTDIGVFPKSGNPGGAYAFSAAPGTYYITADFNNLKVTLEPVSLTLNKTTIALAAGTTETLTATANPEIEGTSVVWSTSDAAVATVSTSGKVTGVGNGTADITATYGALTATCKVYVGKKPQSILWSQALSGMRVGESVNLTATATSGLDVTYTVTNGTEVARLDEGGILVALKSGVATVEARQTGDDNYAPAAAVSKTVTVTLNYIPGDVLDDGAVTVDDAIALVNYILGRPVMVDGVEVSVNTAAANVNGDEHIDVVDASLVVNIVLDAVGVQSVSSPNGTIEVGEDGKCRIYAPNGDCIYETIRQPQILK